MKTLLPSNESIIKLCVEYAGDAAFLHGAKLRTSAFTVAEQCEEGVLVFNTLTGELILLEPHEYRIFTEECPEKADMDGVAGELARRLFLLPAEIDEFAFVDDLRFMYELKQKKRSRQHKYYIYTTTGCNARCPYCFEEGVRPRTMNKETALRAAEYMIECSGGQKLFLVWFGGEPLMNKAAMDAICERLRGSGVEFESIIKTNGYLFEPEGIAEYRSRCNLSFAQIPLDGMGEEYNGTKAYVNVPEGTDPYLRVMENIRSLLESGIRVDVRFNIGLKNASETAAILSELKRRFSSYEGFAVYPQVLNEGAFSAFTAIERRMLFEAQKSAYVFCRENGIRIARGLYSLPSLKLHSCFADDPRFAGISPEGKLCKCPENPNSPHIFGDIFEGPANENEGEKAVVYEKHDWQCCRRCPFYPNCVNLRLCVARGRECDEFHRDFRLWKVKRIMRETARAYSVGASSVR